MTWEPPIDSHAPDVATAGLPPRRFKGGLLAPPPAAASAAAAAAKANMPAFRSDRPSSPLAVKQKRGSARPSPEERIAMLLKAYPVPASLATYLLHVIERFDAGKQPGDDAEAQVFATIKRLRPQARQALSRSAKAVRTLPPAISTKLSSHQLTVRSLDQPILLHSLADPFAREAINLGRALQGYLAGGPQFRPWGVRIAGDTPIVVEAPWPFICSVNGYRKADHRPPLGVYRPEELEQTCTYRVPPNASHLRPGDIEANCTYRRSGCGAGHTVDGICLHVPVVRPGEEVVLQGFNFGAEGTRVKLVHSQKRDVVYDLPCSVLVDTATPGRDGNGAVIADCRVKDQIRFTVPTTSPDTFHEFVPGVYRLDVEVPNTTGDHVLGSRPDRLTTATPRNTAVLDVLPPADLSYRVWVDASRNIVEEYLEPGSDEVRLFAVVATVGADGVIDLHRTEMPHVLEDFSEGDIVTNFVWDLLGQGTQGVAVPNHLVVGLAGWEVDDEDALDDEVQSFYEAFTAVLERVWDLVKDRIAEIAKALASLGLVGLLVAGIAVAVVLIFGLIWAAWAPPDLVLFDSIGLNSSLLYRMTDPSAPAVRSPDHNFYPQVPVSVHVDPPAKLGYRHTEWRRYTYKADLGDPNPDSVYAFRFRIQREH
jgi:hypothetical protein